MLPNFIDAFYTDHQDDWMFYVKNDQMNIHYNGKMWEFDVNLNRFKYTDFTSKRLKLSIEGEEDIWLKFKSEENLKKFMLDLERLTTERYTTKKVKKK